MAPWGPTGGKHGRSRTGRQLTPSGPSRPDNLGKGRNSNANKMGDSHPHFEGEMLLEPIWKVIENVIDGRLFEQDLHWAHFERLRAEDPVHLNELPAIGRYWSITKFEDIMFIDKNHDNGSK